MKLTVLTSFSFVKMKRKGNKFKALVKMSRTRKYDYNVDYPLTLFIKIPIQYIKELEKLGYTQRQVEEMIQNDKIINKYLQEIIDKKVK